MKQNLQQSQNLCLVMLNLPSKPRAKESGATNYEPSYQTVRVMQKPSLSGSTTVKARTIPVSPKPTLTSQSIPSAQVLSTRYFLHQALLEWTVSLRIPCRKINLTLPHLPLLLVHLLLLLLLVHLPPAAAGAPPPAAAQLSSDPFDDGYKATANSGNDGGDIVDTDISAPNLEATKEGLWALSKVDLFNLLCIPPLSFDLTTGSTTGIDINSTVSTALGFCEKRRAFFIVDPPTKWSSVDLAAKGMQGDNTNSVSLPANNHGGVFFPYVIAPDALSQNRLTDFAPCGVMAGIFATTDAQRGVWKAPAGIDAVLSGVAGLTVAINDNDNGRLNPLGVNCLRSFPVTGRVAWGSRTLRGDDQLTDDYKYIPVRRTALFIEESLYRGLQWAVFEPNDEPLWAQIRLNVGAFMQDLFRKGAFQGKTPRDAYLVKCDKETTTQNDINLGIVNILVGFAPLKPAEFVIVTIQQLAGQIQV